MQRQQRNSPTEAKDAPGAAPERAQKDGGPSPRHVDVEFLGPYKGSGFKDPPYLVRRPDGQVIQLPRPLYAVLEAADGTTSLEQIADKASDAIEQRIDADGAQLLIEKKLRPLGLLDGDTDQKVEAVDPLLALKFKKGVVPAKLVHVLTLVFRPFFFGPVVVAALVSLAIFDWWLFGIHGIAQALRQTIYEPGYLLALFGIIVLAAALHEIGHATACAYGGATPGEMGVGLYVIWPAFYTDVTDSYRLGRGGRLRTDFGGVYFNTLVILALGGLYAATRIEFLLLAALVQHFAILQQMLPFLRLDGYYIVADLTGVPDMYTRIRPILASMLPWRKTDERVTELTWWARAIVTLWVLAIVPLTIYIVGLVVLHLPRIIATAWNSGTQLRVRANSSFQSGDMLAGSTAIGQIILLSLPVLAAVLTSSRIGKRIVGGGWRSTSDKPVARAGFLAAIVGLLALVTFIWWPNQDYRPIQPYERWTAAETVGTFTRVPRGDPGIAPFERGATSGGTTGSTQPSGTQPASDPNQGGSPQPTPEPDGSESPAAETESSPSESPTDEEATPSPSESPSG